MKSFQCGQIDCVGYNGVDAFHIALYVEMTNIIYRLCLKNMT